MSEHRYWRRRAVDRVIDQLRRSDSPPRIDREPRGIRRVGENEPPAPWLVAPGEQQRGTRSSDASGRNPEPRATGTPTGRHSSDGEHITRMLQSAHAETQMDVAILGEICDGHEVARYLAGDGASFGLNPGASMPIEDTYCHRLLTGRLSNVVGDAQANEQVRDLEITRAARVGAYIGVPLTGLDARLYVLCCLAHEQRPQLGERDVLFLRDLGETILAALEEHQARPGVS
jgi:GAF domain-containing protein